MKGQTQVREAVSLESESILENLQALRIAVKQVGVGSLTSRLSSGFSTTVVYT